VTTESATTSDRDQDRIRQKDRRARRTTVHLPERRTGFDRRTNPSAGRARVAYLGWIRRLSESPERAAMLMISIVVLNIADIAFTFRALDRGLPELNPVMAGLLDAGHGVAALVKIGVPVALAVAGWRLRRFRRVIEVALFVVTLMSVVVLYHLLGSFVA
jgi:Domain of unknown function (DUF5658)